MVNRSREEKKQEVLSLLKDLPEEFKWNNVNGPMMTRDGIRNEVEAGSKIGEDFVDLTDGLVPSNGPNVLGKRYTCLVCRIEVLNTQSGKGENSVVCCDQKMWLQRPRFIPSAD